MDELKLVGFDIETAKVVPEGTSLRDARPLGVTCVAFDGPDFDETIAAAGTRMTPMEVAKVLERIEELIAQGYKIATWNGLAFDFDVLAEEATPDVARRLAEIAVSEHHVDVMWQFFCVKGFRVALAKACEAMGLEGKNEGMSGAKAPELWAAGKRNEVLEYVAQDARIQRLVAEEVQREGRVKWITRAGKLSEAPIGQLSPVPLAALFPEPDTSWMDEPAKREWFAAWVKRYGVETPIR